MKLYNALIKKNHEGKIEDILLLREGFSVMAFLFSAFWFLYHKMRREFLVLLVVNFAFAFAQKLNFLSGFDEMCLQMAFFFVVALNANYWLMDDLKKRGYEFAGLVFGNDVASARMRLFDNLRAENMLGSFELAGWR